MIAADFELADLPARPLQVIPSSHPSSRSFQNKWISHELTADTVQADPPAARPVAWHDDQRFRADARRCRLKDYPGIGRFAGSVITGYQVKDFDATRMQAAPFKDGKATDERRLEGHITRIAYRTEPGPSILEVSRNFETQLAKAGFETLLACDDDACGGIPFTEAIDALPIPQMWIDGFNYRYFAGARRTAGARPMPPSSSARTTTISTRSSSSPKSATSRTRWWTPRRWPRGSARPATSRSTASISTPTRRW